MKATGGESRGINFHGEGGIPRGEGDFLAYFFKNEKNERKIVKMALFDAKNHPKLINYP